MNNLVATKRRLAVHVTQLEKLSCGATVLKVKKCIFVASFNYNCNFEASGHCVLW